MQVVTLNPKDLDAHAERLARAVEESVRNGFDAIVAIRRGGSIVCDAFLRHFPETLYSARFDVSLQRPSTKNKKETLRKILQRLPYPLLDAMRKAEAHMFSLRKKFKGASSTVPVVEIPEDLAAALTRNPLPEILVIDDAIDSGDTLYAIVHTLRKTNPEARISIAVITETTDKPRIRAKHSLYRNRTLIRFPWSDDYKTPIKTRSGE
ncbi:MAG: hypothetical protein K2K98_03235 [Muribaculaceae bacterium]|nr:hypothetical protein [Muribaculaceae bacterium]